MTSNPVAAFALAAAALLASADAGAITVTSISGAPDPGPRPGERTVVSFDAPSAPGFTWSGGIATASGSTRGQFTAPAGNSSIYGYVSSRLADPVVILHTPALTSISFYWGTMDSHNWLSVLGAQAQPIAFVNVISPGSGSAGRNRRLVVTAGPGETIHGLRFWARGAAFEFDDFAATLAATPENPAGSVPEPESWAMLIAGMGLVGAIARRRRQTLTLAA